MRKIDIIKKKLIKKRFKPKRFLSNTHLQTILGVTTNKKNKIVYKAQRRRFKVNNDFIEGDCYWQENKNDKATILIVHGIGGSSREHYVLRFIKKAFENKYNVVALNLRSCGGTEKISKRLYNSGDSKDILFVIKNLFIKDKLSKFFILGFSLGGNICLKLAGEIKRNYKILGIATISPLIDLKTAEKNIDYNPKNKFYQKRILNSLKSIIIKKSPYFPIYDSSKLRDILTIRNFDKTYHVDIGEFKSVDFYYNKVSAINYIKKIKIPTLIIHSKDDPVIPVKEIKKAIKMNKNIIGLISKYGGHAGFIGERQYNDIDEFWAENRVLEFFNYLK